MPGAAPAGMVSLNVTIASPPAATLVVEASETDHAPVPEVGMARLPSEGWPPEKAKVTFTLPLAGAACTTNFCDCVVPALTAPTCHVPWKSFGPVPASAPEPEPTLYRTTPLRSACTAWLIRILPAPSPSGP